MKRRLRRSRILMPARRAAWRWTIRTLRDILWRVDDWVHDQEVKIQREAGL